MKAWIIVAIFFSNLPFSDAGTRWMADGSCGEFAIFYDEDTRGTEPYEKFVKILDKNICRQLYGTRYMWNSEGKCAEYATIYDPTDRSAEPTRTFIGYADKRSRCKW